MTGPLWVVFRAQNYCFGCLFGNPIIFMGLFLGPLFLWVCFWAGIIFLGQIFIRMTFFCLLKLKFHYFYGYLFGQNYFYGSFFARQIIFFGTGKISGAGHPRHFGILTTPPEEENLSESVSMLISLTRDHIMWINLQVCFRVGVVSRLCSRVGFSQRFIIITRLPAL